MSDDIRDVNPSNDETPTSTFKLKLGGPLPHADYATLDLLVAAYKKHGREHGYGILFEQSASTGGVIKATYVCDRSGTEENPRYWTDPQTSEERKVSGNCKTDCQFRIEAVLLPVSRSWRGSFKESEAEITDHSLHNHHALSLGPSAALTSSAPSSSTSDVNISADKKSKGPGPLTTFTFFPKLPAELRIKIYCYMMLHPRVLQIRRRDQHGKEVAVPRGITPAVLQVCNESRLETLKYCKEETSNDLIFNTDVDTLYLPFPQKYIGPECNSRYSKFVDVVINGYSGLDEGGLQNIALDYHSASKLLRRSKVSGEFTWWIAELPCKLPILQKIKIFWSAHDTTQVVGDSPTFPQTWEKDMAASAQKTAFDTTTAIDFMSHAFRFFIRGQDEQMRGHILLRSPHSSTQNCLRDTRMATHASVEVLVEQVQRITDLDGRKKAFQKLSERLCCR